MWLANNSTDAEQERKQLRQNNRDSKIEAPKQKQLCLQYCMSSHQSVDLRHSGHARIVDELLSNL